MCWRKHLPVWKCQCTEKAMAAAEIGAVKQRLESVRLRIDTLEQERNRRGQPPPVLPTSP